MAGYLEDFEELTNGDIDGQDNWTVNSGSMTVQTSTVKNGSKALQMGATSYGRRAFTGDEISNTDNDIISFWAYKSAVSDYCGINFKDTDEAGHYIGNIRFYDGDIEIISDLEGPITVLSTYSATTWYFIEAQFDYTNEQFRARVDGGTWSAWCDFGASGTQNEVDQIEIDGNKEFFIDDLNLAYVAAATFNPKVTLIT